MKRLACYRVCVTNDAGFLSDNRSGDSVWADAVSVMKDGRTVLKFEDQVVGVCPPNGYVALLFYPDTPAKGETK